MGKGQKLASTGILLFSDSTQVPPWIKLLFLPYIGFHYGLHSSETGVKINPSSPKLLLVRYFVLEMKKLVNETENFMSPNHIFRGGRDSTRNKDKVEKLHNYYLKVQFII